MNAAMLKTLNPGWPPGILPSGLLRAAARGAAAPSLYAQRKSQKLGAEPAYPFNFGNKVSTSIPRAICGGDGLNSTGPDIRATRCRHHPRGALPDEARQILRDEIELPPVRESARDYSLTT